MAHDQDYWSKGDDVHQEELAEEGSKEHWDNMTFWKAGYDAGYNSALKHDALNDLIGHINIAASIIVVVNLFALIIVLALA